MKHEWGREMYIEQCNFKESMELGWIRLGIWRLRCKRRDAIKEAAPYLMKLRMWLIEAQRWREQFVDNK